MNRRVLMLLHETKSVLELRCSLIRPQCSRHTLVDRLDGIEVAGDTGDWLVVPKVTLLFVDLDGNIFHAPVVPEYSQWYLKALLGGHASTPPCPLAEDQILGLLLHYG